MCVCGFELEWPKHWDKNWTHLSNVNNVWNVVSCYNKEIRILEMKRKLFGHVRRKTKNEGRIRIYSSRIGFE